MTEQAWGEDEQKLLAIRNPSALEKSFESTPQLPITRRIALLARIDERAAYAYARKLQAEESVIEAGISLWRTISKAMNIEVLIERDRAEMDRENELIEKRHELALAELEEKIDVVKPKAKAPTTKSAPPTDRERVAKFEYQLDAIHGSEAADRARELAVRRKQAIDIDPFYETENDREHARALVDQALIEFLDKLRKRTQ